MTTLYRPVRIETVEQADALPEGTIAILDDETTPVALHVTKTAEHLMPWRNGKHVGAGENVVGALALVPIEAEEETRVSARHVGTSTEDGIEFDERTGEPAAWENRLVTPWEDA